MRSLPVMAVLLLLALVAAHIATAWILEVGLVDDAYIFLRYADNFARGEGLVFNPGERVEGYTSPLWMAVTAGLALLPIDLPGSERFVSVLLGVATAALFYGACVRFLPRGGRPLYLAAAIGLMIDPCVTFWISSGMETSLATLLVLLTLVLFMRGLEGDGSMALPGFVLALGALTRPEMLALFPGLVWLCPPGRRARFSAPMLLLAFHVAARYLYYGSWLPNTYYAKAGVPLVMRIGNGAGYLGRFLIAYAPLLAAIVIFAVLSARLRRGLSYRLWLPAVIMAVLYSCAVVAEGGDHFPLYRFFVPMLPLLMWLLVVLVVGRLEEPEAQRDRRPARHAPTWPRWAGGLLVAAFILQGLAVYRFHDGSRARGEVTVAQAWAEVGKWLHRNVPADTKVAALGIGAVAYYSRLEIIDLFGLTNLEVARHGKVEPEAMIGHQKYNTEYVLGIKPAIILYPTAGWFEQPRYRNRIPAGVRFHNPLLRLSQDARTRRWYEYAGIRMDDGHYLECLILKDQKWRLAGPAS